MQKKPARSTRKQKNESRGIPISDAGLDEFERTVKKAAERNQKGRRAPSANPSIPCEMIRERIRENDARRAVTTTSFLDYELHNTGFVKPFYAKLSWIKAYRKSAENREEKFDWYAIQEEVNEIWRRHRSYSKSRAARIIQERFEERGEPDILKIDTTGKKINEPT